MGIIKGTADLIYTFRFLRLLTTNFEDTEAYKAGIIDAKGKRVKSFDLNLMANREKYNDYYTPFHRLVFNIKKLIPGGKIGTYAAALYLIKENYNVSDKKLEKVLNKVGIDSLDLMTEGSRWFVLEDQRLTPGAYRVRGEKVLNKSMDEMVKEKDWVTVNENCYPVGNVFGIDIYEATHKRTRQKVYVTIDELIL